MPKYEITEEWIEVYTATIEADNEQQAANRAMSATTQRVARRRVVTIEEVKESD